jgi:hypothetical protein
VGCFVTPDERPRDVTAFCAGEWRDLTASVPLYLCEASCAGLIARQSLCKGSWCGLPARTLA